MENKRCSVDQRINGQRIYQRTTEVVPSSAYSTVLLTCTENTYMHVFEYHVCVISKHINTQLLLFIYLSLQNV
jgi:hypothetical protein